MRRRFFADEVDAGAAVIRGANAGHLARVLRAEPGQQYELAHAGRVYLGEIVRAGRDEVRFTIVEELPPPPALRPIHVAVALFKADRFEWMLEKATELGVASIQPLITRRTDAHRAAAHRAERWRKILFESAQQARPADWPRLEPVLPLARFLAAPPPGERALLSEIPGGVALAGGPGPLVLLTGPEGGWAPEEIEAAQAAGFASVSLGPLILRCETAILAALARATA
jgi:16S rRNA (uracil1498-N3)-methyltransferase